MNSPRWLTTPTLLSLLRIPLGMIFPFVVELPWEAVAVLAVAGITDVLDGWLARKLHQETKIGAWVDGIADKWFVFIVALSLVYEERIHIWQMVLLGSRDLGELVLLVGAWARGIKEKQTEQKANVLGKLTTVGQFVSVVMALFSIKWLSFSVFLTALVGSVAFVVYGYRLIRQFSPSRTNP